MQVNMVFEYKKNDDGHYVCGVCNVIKKNQNTMHYHLKRHEGTMSYECDKCDMKFYQKYTLDTHTKLVHEKKEASIKCPFERSPKPRKISATIRATVVFPVPGFPVKTK